jgi:hypothetical protein
MQRLRQCSLAGCWQLQHALFWLSDALLSSSSTSAEQIPNDADSTAALQDTELAGIHSKHKAEGFSSDAMHTRYAYIGNAATAC